MVLSILPIVFKGTSAKIIACIHDEIIIECNKEEQQKVSEILQATMEKVGAIYLREVPVIAEANISMSWAGK